jgi:hypothetical protein
MIGTKSFVGIPPESIRKGTWQIYGFEGVVEIEMTFEPMEKATKRQPLPEESEPPPGPPDEEGVQRPRPPDQSAEPAKPTEPTPRAGHQEDGLVAASRSRKSINAKPRKFSPRHAGCPLGDDLGPVRVPLLAVEVANLAAELVDLGGMIGRQDLREHVVVREQPCLPRHHPVLGGGVRDVVERLHVPGRPRIGDAAHATAPSSSSRTSSSRWAWRRRRSGRSSRRVEPPIVDHG